MDVTTEGTEDGLGELREQLAQLNDLFRRRLADDRDKRRLIDELEGQLDFARRGLAQQFLLPLVRDLLLVADRALAIDDAAAASLGHEVIDVLARYGVESVPSDTLFDPAMHEAVGSQEGPAEEAGTIAQVERDGYRLGGTLVRPARVIVIAEAPTAQD